VEGKGEGEGRGQGQAERERDSAVQAPAAQEFLFDFSCKSSLGPFFLQASSCAVWPGHQTDDRG
jgi:hypothetical protein